MNLFSYSTSEMSPFMWQSLRVASCSVFAIFARISPHLQCSKSNSDSSPRELLGTFEVQSLYQRSFHVPLIEKASLLYVFFGVLEDFAFE